MLIPLRTDRRLKRTPWVNYGLIAANVVIFLITFPQIVQAGDFVILPRQLAFEELPVLAFFLWPDEPHVYQFISYQFLHANWMHLIGNMLFLWVFGNGVEDRLGRVGYLLFYLAGGVVAGLGHAVAEPTQVIGASGSVAAVTGAFLALFPLSRVTVILFVFLIIPFQIPAITLILFRAGVDVVFHFLGVDNVAYLAHLAGYGFGFVIGLGLLIGPILSREPYDLLSLIEHRRRRTQFQRMARSGYQPWDHAPAATDRSLTQAAPELKPEQEKLMQTRREISAALARHDNATAASIYRDLLEEDSSQVLGQQAQLDVANQLMSEGRYAAAANAYELFLKHYPAYMQREQIQLILGLIYARYLQHPDRARELLNQAADKLDNSNRELAQRVLAEIEKA